MGTVERKKNGGVTSRGSKRRPVIFVFAIQNYFKFNGISISSEAYSSYPREQEVILQEGMDMFVLSVERNFLIKNEHPCFEQYNGQKVDIGYLFNQC